ncbi:MAG: hypothetical protein ABMA64_01245 [Myxococcota bacterium]
MQARSSVGWLLLVAGCTHPLYDTTVWFGGAASMSLTPTGEGVTATLDGPGAPAVRDLAACKSYLQRQEPRREGELAPNRVLDLCFPAATVEGPCFAEPPEVELVVLNREPYLVLYAPDGTELSASLGPIDGFTYEPEGSLTLTVTLEGTCAAGATEHQLDATWSFDQSESFEEGRSGDDGGWLGDV